MTTHTRFIQLATDTLDEYDVLEPETPPSPYVQLYFLDPDKEAVKEEKDTVGLISYP